MPDYIRQIECLACSNSRIFAVRQDTRLVLISQTDAALLPPSAPLACGRCGSVSLVRGWGDSIPYATKGYVSRRRRRRRAAVEAVVLPACPV